MLRALSRLGAEQSSQLRGAALAHAAADEWLAAAAAAQPVSLFSTQAAKAPAAVFVGPPCSLEFPRQPDSEVQAEQHAGLLRRAMLRLGGYYSRQSRLMRGAEGLYAAVTEQADDPCLAAALQLPPGFQPRHALLCLHVWLVLVRLRPEGADGRDLAQMMYDNFQEDVDRRVRKAGVKVRLFKQLTELEKQFYGSSMAYDKALRREGGAGAGAGQEMLAAALLRNVFMADASKSDAAVALERYCLRELACLSMTESGAVMAGNVKFSQLAGRPPPASANETATTARAAAQLDGSALAST